MNNERMQAAIKELQDAMVVMAHIEKRQSEMLNVHSDYLAEIAEFRHRTEKNLAEISEFRRRTEQNLAEMTDKLNGLIGYVAGQRPGGELKQ
jgi:predicted  nucleic acid-binding Zn-ribbon protein